VDGRRPPGPGSADGRIGGRRRRANRPGHGPFGQSPDGRPKCQKCPNAAGPSRAARGPYPLQARGGGGIRTTKSSAAGRYSPRALPFRLPNAADGMGGACTKLAFARLVQTDSGGSTVIVGARDPHWGDREPRSSREAQEPGPARPNRGSRLPGKAAKRSKAANLGSLASCSEVVQWKQLTSSMRARLPNCARAGFNLSTWLTLDRIAELICCQNDIRGPAIWDLGPGRIFGLPAAR
jgi:hypothetical protein